MAWYIARPPLVLFLPLVESRATRSLTLSRQSTYRIYLWLVLLDVSPVPTDEYLSLIHRGRSPAYTKIRNDTFRTMATDPLFKRRVTEASLIRLLNAVAWKLHDAKNKYRSRSRPSSRLREIELLINTPPSIEEEPSPSGTPGSVASSRGGSSGITNESAIYVQGMNVLCAPFLYAARSEVEAFALFHSFITRECPGYIRGAMDGVHRGLRLVDQCLEIVEPKLAAYLFSKGLQAKLYAFPSVLTLCACTPPLPEVLHLWDFLFAYGTHLNILCIVAQLIRMRDTILESPRYVFFFFLLCLSLFLPWFIPPFHVFFFLVRLVHSKKQYHTTKNKTKTGINKTNHIPSEHIPDTQLPLRE